MPVKLANLNRENPFDKQNIKNDIFAVKKRMENVKSNHLASFDYIMK